MHGRRELAEEDIARETRYYTDTEIPRLLGISLGRLRDKFCAGSSLPPRIQPPACQNRLWHLQAVHDWLEQFTITVTDTAVLQRPSKCRGRPSKEEERARR